MGTVKLGYLTPEQRNDFYLTCAMVDAKIKAQQELRKLKKRRKAHSAK